LLHHACSLSRPPQTPTLFPYTTLFRSFGLRLTPDEGRDICRIGEMIKAATSEQLPVVHPENPEIAGVTIAELTGPATNPKAAARSEEHTSELQSPYDLVCRLLLEKKKK